MKTFNALHWPSLALFGSAVIATIGVAGCRATPLTLQPPVHSPGTAESTAEALTHSSDASQAAPTGSDAAPATTDSQLSLEAPTPLSPSQPGPSQATSAPPAPGVSRPLSPQPSTVAATEPMAEASEAGWDSVEPRANGGSSATTADSAPHGEAMTAVGWTTTGHGDTQGNTSEPIQLTGHEEVSAPAVPLRPGHANAAQPPQAPMTGSAAQPECDDCLPGISDWQQQLQQQTDDLSEKVEQLEKQLEMSRQALESVNAALKESNRELSRLSNDVRFWRGEVKRIESVMERQHQQDIKSLDALSATLEQLMRDDYRASRNPAARQNSPR